MSTVGQRMNARLSMGGPPMSDENGYHCQPTTGECYTLHSRPLGTHWVAHPMFARALWIAPASRLAVLSVPLAAASENVEVRPLG
jgi:hypothetical protein